MTRTGVMASSRPHTAGAASTRKGPSAILRRLAIIPVVLLLALALMPSGALAAEPNTTSGYNQEPNKPATGTSPSKETGTPAAEEPAPAAEPATPKTSTLPFTGFDLRWSIGLGLLLMGTGVTIVVMQRRQRHEDGR